MELCCDSYQPGFVAISGEDARMIGPKLLEHLVRIWPEAVEFSEAAHAKNFKRAAKRTLKADFLICLPKNSSDKPSGSPSDKVGIRLLDLLEVNGYQFVNFNAVGPTADSAGQTLCQSVFRKI